jgi:hypothetical protein
VESGLTLLGSKVRYVKREPHTTKHVESLEDTLFGREELNGTLGPLRRIRTYPIKFIRVSESSDELVRVALLNFLNIDAESWDILLPCSNSNSITSAMGDRTNNSYWPKRLTLFTTQYG